MDAMAWVALGCGVMTIVVGVIGYLLSRKDASQQEAIRLLFLKHDADVAALQELREKIAGKHYERRELDQKFDKLERSIVTGLERLGDKFDHYQVTIMQFLESQNGKGK